MTEDTPEAEGWFAALESGAVDDPSTAIREGSATEPRDWPSEAVAAGFASDEGDYYDRLHEATVECASTEITELETAEDSQLAHTIRAMDDCERTANELAERVSEWGSSVLDETGAGLEYVRRVAEHEPQTATEARLVATAQRSVDLADEATDLRSYVERRAPEIAPNLSSMAGPILAARLISLAGGLEPLAKMPSSTVQVLGAEDALFAHLSGGADPPKHGVIFTHEYVSGTDPEHRGSAARAVAGKLTIAARIDHYAGDRRPELERELDDRIETIQARSGGEDG